jgi:flavin-dependent dehydrogenase
MAYDAIVMGAGVSGSATAWFCSQKGQRVALVDKAKFPRDKICTSTINPRSCSYLQQLGVLETLQNQDGLIRIRGIQTFSYDGESFRGFYEPSGSYLNYGHTIPRHRLDAAVLSAAHSQPGVDYYEEFEIREIRVNEEDGQVLVKGEHHGQSAELRAPIAVDAAGRGSLVARVHGLFTPWDEHRRFALIGQFGNVRQADHFFNVGTNDEIGPGYFCVFPISGDLAIASLMLTERDWVRVQPDPKKALSQFINGNWLLRDWFAKAETTTPAVAFGPLAFKSRAVVLDRILMVGDTTGFYDPLTGEGITFAFRSAELAAEAIARFCANGLWPEVAGWYERLVHLEKDGPLQQAILLQRMLGLREGFNRFVNTLAETPEAANWLARSLGNLLPYGERSIETFKAVLEQPRRKEVTA